MQHRARLLLAVLCHGSWSEAAVFATDPEVAFACGTKSSKVWTLRLSAVLCSDFLEASPPCASGAGLGALLGFPLSGRAGAVMGAIVVALL